MIGCENDRNSPPKKVNRNQGIQNLEVKEAGRPCRTVVGLGLLPLIYSPALAEVLLGPPRSRRGWGPQCRASNFPTQDNLNFKCHEDGNHEMFSGSGHYPPLIWMTRSLPRPPRLQSTRQAAHRNKATMTSTVKAWPIALTTAAADPSPERCVNCSSVARCSTPTNADMQIRCSLYALALPQCNVRCGVPMSPAVALAPRDVGR